MTPERFAEIKVRAAFLAASDDPCHRHNDIGPLLEDDVPELVAEVERLKAIVAIVTERNGQLMGSTEARGAALASRNIQIENQWLLIGRCRDWIESRGGGMCCEPHYSHVAGNLVPDHADDCGYSAMLRDIAKEGS